MGDTRREMMYRLLAHKPRGLTVGELSRELGITRTAVQQHITGLERDGLVTPMDIRSTGGRPGRAYGLTERGLEEFPRRYALLAQGLLATAAETLGEEGLERLLESLSARIAADVAPRLPRDAGPERREAVIGVMNELGYEAAPLSDAEGIEASNCVYHEVARQSRAVCRYDVRLLTLLLGEEVRHARCMLDGDGRCAFTIRGDAPGQEATPRNGEGGGGDAGR